jgi:hypothetical protein
MCSLFLQHHCWTPRSTRRLFHRLDYCHWNVNHGFFVTTFNILVAGKLLLGFGAVLQQIDGPMLVTELAHPRHREALTSFYNTNIYIGLVLVLGSWITFGTYSIPNNWPWRIPVLLQIALSIYQLVMIYLCPVLPRWLVMKGRHYEALAILTKYHGNGIETPQVQAEFQEMVAGVEVDQSQMELTWAGVKSLIGKRANQHRLLVAFVTVVGSQCAGSELHLHIPPQSPRASRVQHIKAENAHQRDYLHLLLGCQRGRGPARPAHKAPLALPLQHSEALVVSAKYF